jgi:hypothetical protein
LGVHANQNNLLSQYLTGKEARGSVNQIRDVMERICAWLSKLEEAFPKTYFPTLLLFFHWLGRLGSWQVSVG